MCDYDVNDGDDDDDVPLDQMGLASSIHVGGRGNRTVYSPRYYVEYSRNTPILLLEYSRNTIPAVLRHLFPEYLIFREYSRNSKKYSEVFREYIFREYSRNSFIPGVFPE